MANTTSQLCGNFQSTVCQSKQHCLPTTQKTTIWHENLHGIKFYGFTVGDTTVELKSVNFYSINSAMSLLKIRHGTWRKMMPDLIKTTAYI